MLLLNVAQTTMVEATPFQTRPANRTPATVFESEQVTGTLLPEIASELGLTRLAKSWLEPVIARRAPSGMAWYGPVIVTTSLGTSGVVFVHADSPQYDTEGRLHTFCHAVNGKWHMMGVTFSAAGSLQWFVEQALNTPKANKTITYRRIFEGVEQNPNREPGTFSCPTWPANARLMPTPMLAAAGSG